MDTQPKVDEVARLEAINRELCQKIVDLQAQIERKNKAVEGFMLENEALKQELGGKPGKPAEGNGRSRHSDLDERIARWRNGKGANA